MVKIVEHAGGRTVGLTFPKKNKKPEKPSEDKPEEKTGETPEENGEDKNDE